MNRTPDVKDLNQLQVGARLLNNSATGYIIVQFENFDGGPFQLRPKLTENSVVLVDPGRPGGYGVELRGDSDALRRIAVELGELADQQDRAAAEPAE